MADFSRKSTLFYNPIFNVKNEGERQALDSLTRDDGSMSGDGTQLLQERDLQQAKSQLKYGVHETFTTAFYNFWDNLLHN